MRRDGYPGRRNDSVSLQCFGMRNFICFGVFAELGRNCFHFFDEDRPQAPGIKFNNERWCGHVRCVLVLPTISAQDEEDYKVKNVRSRSLPLRHSP